MSNISLHVGCDTVDPDQYGGFRGGAGGSDQDAASMQELAISHGFESSQPITYRDATPENVLSWLESAEERTVPGDTLLLTYSGHGFSITPDEGIPGPQPAWALYDRLLLDLELFSAFDRLPGRRIVVVTDCCYEGFHALNLGRKNSTIHRYIDRDGGDANYQMRREFFNNIIKSSMNYAGPNTRADIVGLAACADTEEAGADDDGGYFTIALLKQMAHPVSILNYETLIENVRNILRPQHQTPQLLQHGAGAPLIVESTPFYPVPGSAPESLEIR